MFWLDDLAERCIGESYLSLPSFQVCSPIPVTGHPEGFA